MEAINNIPAKPIKDKSPHFDHNQNATVTRLYLEHISGMIRMMWKNGELHERK
ncbi:MAG: hypothetical protein IID18_09075 [Nitrospinae bacterium]|nr:hypothetical protein [Nitrospinota bacterium]